MVLMITMMVMMTVKVLVIGVVLAPQVKKHGVALLEIIEKHVLFWWSGGRRVVMEEWRRREGSARLTVFAASQSDVFCVATRPAAMEYRLAPSNVVTGIGANTTPVNNKQKRE